MATAIRVAVGFALLAYPIVVYLNLTMSPPMDPAGELFTAIFTLVLWLNLSLALLLTGIQNGIPFWSGAAAVVLIPWFCASAIPVAELLVRKQSLRWMTAVPAAVGPLVILAYVGWASIPGNSQPVFREFCIEHCVGRHGRAPAHDSMQKSFGSGE